VALPVEEQLQLRNDSSSGGGGGGGKQQQEAERGGNAAHLESYCLTLSAQNSDAGFRFKTDAKNVLQ
jgi:hypothetical protein